MTENKIFHLLLLSSIFSLTGLPADSRNGSEADFFRTSDSSKRIRLNKDGLPEEIRFIKRNASGIDKILYKYSNAGYASFTYRTDSKKPAEEYFEVLENGWELKRKTQIRGNKNLHLERMVYDLNGNQIQLEILNSHGKRTEVNGIAAYRYSYNKGCIESGIGLYYCRNFEAVYGSDGKLKEYWYYRFNEPCLKNPNKLFSDCIAYLAYRGSDHKVKENTKAYSMSKSEYDEKGNVLLREFFDSKNNRKDFFGTARTVYKYDDKKKYLILTEQYDSRNRPNSHIFRTAYQYDGQGNRIQEEHFNKDGNLTADMAGIAKSRYRYSQNRMEIQSEHFGKDGNPIETSASYAKTKIIYNKKCLESGWKEYNCIERHEIFGIDGLPKNNAEGIYKYINEYSEICLISGRHPAQCQILSEFHKINGRPGEESFGYVRIVKKFNDECLKIKDSGLDCIIQEDEFREDGKSIPNIRRDYNINCLKVSLRKEDCVEFSVMNTPYKENFQSFYDKEENLIRRRYFETENIGFSEKKYKSEHLFVYKDRRKILEFYFGEDEALIKQGPAKQTFKYDAQGNLQKTEFFDSDDRPTADELGIYSAHFTYEASCLKKAKDAQNCLKTEEYFGLDGRLKDSYSKSARRIYSYHKSGVRTSSISFNSAGEIISMQITPVFVHPKLPGKVLLIDTDDATFSPWYFRIQAADPDPS